MSLVLEHCNCSLSYFGKKFPAHCFGTWLFSQLSKIRNIISLASQFFYVNGSSIAVCLHPSQIKGFKFKNKFLFNLSGISMVLLIWYTYHQNLLPYISKSIMPTIMHDINESIMSDSWICNWMSNSWLTDFLRCSKEILEPSVPTWYSRTIIAPWHNNKINTNYLPRQEKYVSIWICVVRVTRIYTPHSKPAGALMSLSLCDCLAIWIRNCHSRLALSSKPAQTIICLGKFVSHTNDLI